jgi:hypothetical protein
MTQPYSLHARTKGSGTITYRDGRWRARAPAVRGKQGVCLGGHSYRKQAEQAIAAWMAAQPKEEA